MLGTLKRGELATGHVTKLVTTAVANMIMTRSVNQRIEFYILSFYFNVADSPMDIERHMPVAVIVNLEDT